ncbi:MAG: ribonuclease E/G [Planctomycetota bacterium JB042]
MSQKMLINASEPEEIRVAIVEGSILEEYYVERMSVESVLGNIYKGRVTNVEPSIGAAFVDFGGPRHGFLHVSDVLETPIFEREKKAAAEAEAGEGDGAEEEATARAEGVDAGNGGLEEVAGAEEGDVDVHAEEADDAEIEAARDDDADGAEAGPSAEAAAEAETATAVEEAPEPEGADLDAPADETDEADAVGVNGAEASTDAAPAEEEGGSGRGGRSRRRGGRGRGGAGKSASKARENPNPQEGAKRRKNRSIADLLTKGQEVIVQVTKDGIGTKGPTLTTYVSLPGRYLVLMPGLDRKGVSRKIDDGKERDRLKKVLGQLDTRDGLGFIVRTAGVGQTQRALQKDYKYLTKLWDEVEKNAREGGHGKCLYRESDLVIRTIRDVYGPNTGDIIIDHEDCARRARDFLAMVTPRAVKQIKLYDGERPLFSAYGIEEEIGRLFSHRVELQSGGSLVIEQTEALVAIDVNSGRFRDEEDLEETAYKINLEAADAIARQLRLRDLGGVIVVDFIDMRTEKRRRAIERAFKGALRNDRARIKVARISPFGTIEMTRQRVRPSLRHSIFHRCPSCRGAGYVATRETFELNLMRQIKLLLARKNAGLEVFLNPDNAEYIWNRKRGRLLELETEVDKPVHLRIEAELRGDEFRIVPLDAKRAAQL